MADCGPTCLRMIAKFYGRDISAQYVNAKIPPSKDGMTLQSLSELAEDVGFISTGIKVSPEKLICDASLPCIVHWNQSHYVVLYAVKNDLMYVADPSSQRLTLTREEFVDYWASGEQGKKTGVALIMEVSADFYTRDFTAGKPRTGNPGYLLKYLHAHKVFLLLLCVTFIIGSIIQLVFPFVTQAIVDMGIRNKDIHFVKLMLLAQFMLVFGRISMEVLRRWILVYVSTRLNLMMVSDFLLKLLVIPLSYFEKTSVGDLMQRITDHQKIQTFISSASLSILFSLFNFVTFSFILAIYNVNIFLVFISGTVLYVAYILFFFKKRRDLDYRKFKQLSASQTNLIQLAEGISDIKLNGAERLKRWEWERIQANLFKIEVSSTKVLQLQEMGGLVITECKNMIVSFMAAMGVINGDITMGMMLSIQYIIGQLTNPLTETLNFLRQFQDAKIGLERITEVTSQQSENRATTKAAPCEAASKNILVENVSFSYDGFGNHKALHGINIEIVKGQTTAIVGGSGSGKTTLMKLMLQFHLPTAGCIKVEGCDLQDISQPEWRRRCGVVMQDGYLFNDSIARNIALGDNIIDQVRLLEAVAIANMGDVIDSLPLGIDTKLGRNGSGLSQGQKQRVLIARAVYKNPEFLFFDEATSSLDSRNERQIMQNLLRIFEGRTVIVIAHRLSTVRNADNIIVLEAGRIIEQGGHDHLLNKKGEYHALVHNQLV